MTGLAIPVEPFTALELSLMVRARASAGRGGRRRLVFFLEEEGTDPRRDRDRRGRAPLVGHVRLAARPRGRRRPARAVRAVLQFEKPDGNGSLRVDDVKVVASPNPEAGGWTPYHVEDDTIGWLPVKIWRSFGCFKRAAQLLRQAHYQQP